MKRHCSVVAGAALAVGISCTPASGSDDDVFWRGNGWTVTAMYADAGFVGCAATAAFSDEVFLGILNLRNAAWNLTIASHQPVRGHYRLYVDGDLSHEGDARPYARFVDLGSVPAETVSSLKSGGKAIITTSTTRLALVLSGSSDALDEAEKCTATALANEPGDSDEEGSARATGDEGSFSIAANSLGYANLRKGPGINWDIITQIPSGTQGVKRYGKCVPPDDDTTTNLWCPVRWNGFSGMVSTSNLIGELEERSEPAPARTQPEPRREHSSTGTGFFVSREGHILTNDHVAGQCSRLTVTPADGRTIAAELIATDKNNDLALVKISGIIVPSIPPFGTVHQGAQIFVYGFPLTGILSQSGTFTAGTVSAEEGLNANTTQFQMSAAVQPGNSGGPVLDAAGNVVGIVVSKLNSIETARITGDIPQNVNFSIKASAAAIFLSAKGVTPPAPEANARPIETTEIAAHARKITVLIRCAKP